MAWKSFASMLLALCLTLPAMGQEGQQDEEDAVQQPQPVAAAPTTSTPNKVTGLTLPPNFNVPYDEGFITVKAECKGSVEWIVLTTAKKVKYKTHNNEVDISVPPEQCVVTVFAYGYADGKLTRAARCDIKVTVPQPKPKPQPEPEPQPEPTPPPPAPNPLPAPDPTPTPIQGNLIVTVIEDPLKRDLSYTTITRWFSTAAKLQAAGHRPFLKSIRDPAIKNWLDAAAARDKTFADALNRAGVPMMILQDIRGKPLAVGPCPRTEAELFSILQGGK